MLTIFFCAVALVVLVIVAEALSRAGLFGPELKRKSFHLTSGTFIAFWPWLMSFRTIELLGVAMLVLAAGNYFVQLISFTKGIGRRTYGDIFLAVAISLSAYFANNKIFFALAILNVSLADGLAALVGKRYGGTNRYRVFGQPKTIVGTMTFWLVSLCVVGFGLLFARADIEYADYVWLIILLPPAMAALENFSYLGIDNLTVPLAAIAILRLIS